MVSGPDLVAFIERQRVLLKGERDADVERSALVLSSCSPKLLELKGLALNGLGVASVGIGLGGKSLIELERPSAYHTSQLFPPHTFRRVDQRVILKMLTISCRPGDIARIEENTTSQRTASKSSKKTLADGGSTSNALEGVIYRITDSRVIVAVDPGKESGADDIDLPERCRVVKLANSITYDRMDKAIDQLERALQITAEPSEADPSRPREAAPLTPLIEALMGRTGLSDPVPIESLQYMDPSLNDSQKYAVRFALESPEIALIHGPPGTGKTHTLVEIIRQLVGMDKRVLVCGASNLAVDNLLERLVPHGIPLTRLGHPARVLSSLHSSTLDTQAAASDESQIAKDVKAELETVLGALTGKGKGKKPRGAERKKMWDEVKQLRKEYRKREGVVVKNVMGKAKVVLATCHSAGGRQLFNTHFDVLVIDEATQALEAVCWIPILKAKKLILAGDPMQLPPTVLSADQKKDRKQKVVVPAAKGSGTPKKAKDKDAKSKTPKAGTKKVEVVEIPAEPVETPTAEDEVSADEGMQDDAVPSGPSKLAQPKTIKLVPSRSLEVTLFDRVEKMYGSRIKRMLTVQYRMHKKICDFPSNVLYASRLKSHDSVATHLLKDLPGVKDEPDFADVVAVPVVFFDTAGCEYWERVDDEGGNNDEGSKRNENEAMVVKSWVEKLVEAGIQPSQIALITPYQAQVTALSSMLRPSMPELEIGTVDGMQGREKEAVILSLVRSNDKREVGFLKEKRRLNVAMTRPRRHLCVIGDSSTVATGSPYLKKWMEWLEENADVRFGGLD